MTSSNGSNDYSLGQRTVGFQRPVSKKYTPNLAKRQCILSDADGRWSSTVTVSIKPATTQFTKPALNVQMSNGNGSAFQRIGNLQELKEFAHQVAIWADELEPTWQTAIAQGELLETAQRDVQARVDMFQELMNMSPEPMQPPNDYQEYQDADRS